MTPASGTRRRAVSFLVALLISAGEAQQVRTVTFDPAALAAARAAWRSQDPAWRPAFERLRSKADAALTSVPHSVVEKSQTPASGDKHDYMSLARYYWPDTTKPGGLPYKSRDGVVNPEIHTITDQAYCGQMMSVVRTLSLAYAITGDERYARHAALHLRVWFLDSATRMNPNMTYAQGVKGLDDGRPAGIIETRNFGFVCDAATLIAGSASWTREDHARLRAWFRDYLDWLMTHPRARAAAVMANNHSPWFAVQAGTIALFTGEDSLARAMYERTKHAVIDKQIEPDGSQPLELRRTISKNYVFFNLEAFFRLASAARQAGVDLWQYRSEDGRSIRLALDWVLPYLNDRKEWTWKQIKKYQWSDYYPLLVEAYAVYRDPSYAAAARSVADEDASADPIHLFTGPLP